MNPRGSDRRVRLLFGLSLAMAILIALPAGCSRKSSRSHKLPQAAIVSVEPNKGDVARISLVRITTTGFADDFLTDTPTILFDSTPVAFVWPVTSDSVQVRTPPAAGPGFLDVTVDSTTVVQQATMVDAFEYVSVPGGGCSITSVTPSSGPVAGGTDVTIDGSGFTPDAQVFFDVLPATNVIFDSTTQVRATTPAQPTWGVVDVTVSDPVAGVACTAVGAFDYPNPSGPCTITSVCPAEGTPFGGDVITILGTGFEDTPTVRFGTIQASLVTFVSPMEIMATTSATAHSGGKVDVTVENPSGGTCVLPDGFFYRWSAIGPDMDEPNDTQATCTSVPPQLAVSYDRTIHGGDEDWYCLMVFVNPTRTVTLTPDVVTAGNFDLELYDAAGSLIAWSYQTSGPDQVTASGQGNTFAVRVFAVCDTTGDYNLMISD